MQRYSQLVPLVGVGFFVGLTGCENLQFRSPIDRTEVSAPAMWQSAGEGRGRKISSGWLSDFGSRDLRQAVEAAMARNQDLAAAEARMRAAEYVRIAGRSRVKPRAQLGTSGSFSISENGTAATTESESYNLTVSAAWEVDLWGRLRDLNLADDADLAAVRATYRGARLSLAAATARAWINLIAAEQQLELAKVTLDSFERNLRISERNYKGTGQGALDVQFGRTNVAAAKRAVASTRLVRDEAARTLETLTGSYPSGRTRAGSDLPKLSREVPSGIPADLLERRPDLAVARADVYASARRADAARKSLLPSLALTGSGGTPTSRFSDFLNPDWLVASIAASLAQNLYSGGELTAEARAALERNQAAVHDYRQVALEAFREVESALAAEVSLAEQELYLRREVEQAALAEEQSTRDYADGIEGSDILDVLEAQRRANNARSSLIRLRSDRLRNRIDLHLALGGDFSTAES
ncbi:efflux transporter outer membrane subunit [Haloferula sp. A504]|uniref:efflux transporter outer membrane subunit n=1 Tax=Haloferula sp. A504 TaxID=3373601 RepID=UPI0031CC277C|nr:efflux transporter outer membrane subunit [Verrucomicrobiaceae bacterium E54]